MEEQKKQRTRIKIQKSKELVYSAKAQVTKAVIAASTATAITSVAAVNFQQLWK